MPFQAHELVEIERAVSAFMQRRRPPEEIRAELDLEPRIEGQSLEVFERRPTWSGAPGETTQPPVANATVVRSRRHWRVYWQRADLRWHRYDPAAEVQTVQEFLDLLDEDAYACCFGRHRLGSAPCSATPSLAPMHGARTRSARTNPASVSGSTSPPPDTSASARCSRPPSRSASSRWHDNEPAHGCTRSGG